MRAPLLFLRLYSLAFLLGAVSVFGFAPFYLFPLPILALAGLFHLLRQANPGDSLRRAYAFGLGWFLAGVSWVYVSMHDIGMMPLPLAALATVLFAVYLALFPALALWLGSRWPLSPPVRWLLVVPAAWALLEWLRGWLFTGFPWQAVGYSQVPYSPLAGYAPLLGVFGVSWLAALTAGALALRRGWAYVLVAALWLAGWGLASLSWTRPQGAPVRVTLLQGNIAQEMKFRPEKLVDTLLLYQRLILDSDARLIVTPETALPIFLDQVPPNYLEQLAEHARRQGGDLLIGVPEREAEDRYYNSMLAVGSAPTQSYRKVHLVPFGEFVPFGFRWLVDAMNMPLSDFSRGARGQPPLAVAGERVAVNICYEDVFGEELIGALPAATLMVNVSNDAWFGRSFAPWQHLQIAQMRALETGRWWLKANNTGITALLDEKGRVVGRIEPFRVGVLDGEAQGFGGSTPYSGWGNWGFVILALTALIAGGMLRRKRR